VQAGRCDKRPQERILCRETASSAAPRARIASAAAFQLIGAPILGKYSDCFGRRKILLLSQWGTLIAWFLFLAALLLPNLALLSVDSQWLGQFTLSLPLLVLFAGRVLDGLTGGNISVANAYLVDISSETNRKANFGKMAAFSNLGFIIGPVLADVLGATALAEIAPTLAAILISVAGLIVTATMLPEREPTRLVASRVVNRFTMGFADTPCSTILSSTVSTTQARISSTPGTGYCSSMSNANSIDASPRGPDQPRNIFS
jgi:MFS family permease